MASRPLRSSLLSALLFTCFSAAAHTTTRNSSQNLRIDSNLVVLDVVITDKDGNPVRNLPATDFTLLEDGSRQAIKTFEEHSPRESRTPLSAMEALLGKSIGPSPVSVDTPVDIILLDQLNTPMKDQAYARDQVQRYFAGATPATQIALFAMTSDKLLLLQRPTADPALLRAAISTSRAQPHYPVFLDNPISPRRYVKTPDPGGGRHRARMQQTLDSLNALAAVLGRYPGRKNLLWLSAGFSTSIHSDGTEPINPPAQVLEELKQTVNLLAYNQVSIYPIDASALATEPWFDLSNPGAASVLTDTANPSISISSFYSDNAARRASMEELAEATGGKAFVNTNALDSAIARAIASGSDYYTLTYAPTSLKWKGQFRKIKVKFARKGLSLSYRRGYYAIAQRSLPTSTPALAAGPARDK